MINIGMIGYGTIGEQLLELVKAKKAGQTNVKAILVRSPEKVKILQDTLQGEEIEITNDATRFFNLQLDFIVEGAGHDAVRQYSQTALESGSHFIVVSVGVFCDEDLLTAVRRTAKETGKQLIIPSAAIGGLDRVTAGAVGDIDEVKLITRKPPKAWYGTSVEQKLDLANLTEPVCIFTGTARESAKAFPENVNVSAALSIAGVGFEKTNVEVYVDPTLDKNKHEISIKGLFGDSRIQIQNTPSENNPKTGYIVAMSIAKVLNSYTSDIVIGV
ncbi:aspartate dehydrogenase [Bacillus sp. FJAT-45350]|uniref:aspartate dehydrogenase n=1 Tax=Bacillus sp. FJAT-45350 TaxID=2011014 RepID=UPI000BB8E2D9|nr:aspartate dehydrogenase [Bacillus sp. FJAT-45350]